MAKKVFADSEEFELRQPTDVMLDDGATLATSNTIEAVEKMPTDSYVDELAFMAEPITFQIHFGDENDENPVIVGVNGNYRTFYRGQEYTVPRYFVDALITKKGTVSTPIHKTAEGEEMRLIRTHNMTRYPFQIIKEPNPRRGSQWLARRMADLV